MIKEKLQEKLKNQLNKEELNLLPKGFQVIGDIIILNLKPELVKHEKLIAEKILEVFPKIRLVCNKTGDITGEFREPQVKVIATREGKLKPQETVGVLGTETIHLENQCKYKLDITKVMFAKGNINERARISKLIKKNEIIIDMFCGLGYFSIPVAKTNKQKKLYTIEKNPNAYHYFLENIKLNHLRNVEPFLGDNREIIEKLQKQEIKADRILMGYLPPPFDFLDSAFKLAKKGTIIHFEDLLNCDKDKIKEETEKSLEKIQAHAKKAGLKVKLVKLNFVKNYKPHVGHYVLDLEVL